MAEEAPTRRRWFQFGLRTMFAVVACLAVDAAIVGACIRQWREPYSREMVLMPLWYAMPVVGAIFGFGVGLVVERPWLLTLLGFLAAVAYCMLVLAALGFPPIFPAPQS
jgi:hypothetical protein